jgi:hypothetical protein
MLNDAGIDPKTIAKYSGYTSKKVTEKYNIHKCDEKCEEVVNLEFNKGFTV